MYSVWRAGEFGYPSGSNKKIPQTKRMKVIRVDYFPVLEARNPGASASVVKLGRSGESASEELKSLVLLQKPLSWASECPQNKTEREKERERDREREGEGEGHRENMSM